VWYPEQSPARTSDLDNIPEEQHGGDDDLVLAIVNPINYRWPHAHKQVILTIKARLERPLSSPTSPASSQQLLHTPQPPQSTPTLLMADFFTTTSVVDKATSADAVQPLDKSVQGMGYFTEEQQVCSSETWDSRRRRSRPHGHDQAGHEGDELLNVRDHHVEVNWHQRTWRVYEH
jgi:hypothetical protein